MSMPQVKMVCWESEDVGSRVCTFKQWLIIIMIMIWSSGFWSTDDPSLCEELGEIMTMMIIMKIAFPLHCFDFQDISTPKNWSDFEQFIINYRDIVEKPSSHGGGCDVLDMWPDLGASMKKWEWPESNGTDEKWKWPKHSGTNGNRWKKKLKTNFNWGELTGLYKTERMGQARYTRRDLDGAQGKPAASLRVLFRLQISKL